MDGKWLFPHLNGANFHIWSDQMIYLLRSKGLWMYPCLLESDNNYGLLCLKKDEALGFTLYVELYLVHYTKDIKSAKQIWEAFHNLFGTVNTTQVNRLETSLSDLKMADFSIVGEYIARFKNLKAGIVTFGG